MIKNLFTKHEHRVLSAISKEQAVQASAWYWRSRQFAINFSSPYSLYGAQFYSKLGLRQQVSINCFEMGKGVGVDITFSAELTDEGAVVGAVGAVLILPAALAIGAVSYVEYENDAQRLMNDFWSYLSAFPGKPEPPAAPFQSSGAAEEPAREPKKDSGSRSFVTVPVCPKCRATLDPDSRFCKYCGAWL